jgi:hypothetical protein
VQLFLLPLGYLSYGGALALFVAANTVCLAWSVWLVARELAIPWSWPRFWTWGALTISSAAFTTVAVTCEITFILMVPFTLAWRAWRRGQWTTAGAWLGACASAKLFLLLFLPLLIWQRRWKAAAAFVATGCALTVLGAALFGVNAYAQWAATLGRVGWWWIPMNASWQGFVSRALEGSATIAPVIHVPSLVRPVAVAGAGLFALASLVSARFSDGDELRRDRSFLLMFLGAILASPLGWVYYLPLAYGPMLGWLRERRADSRAASGGTIALFIGLACLYIPQEVASWLKHHSIATLTLTSVYFWGVLLLWLAVGQQRWNEHGR